LVLREEVPETPMVTVKLAYGVLLPDNVGRWYGNVLLVTATP